jgi:hypothetical protein
MNHCQPPTQPRPNPKTQPTHHPPTPRPLLQVSSHRAYYPKAHALLLPFTLPLLLLATCDSLDGAWVGRQLPAPAECPAPSWRSRRPCPARQPGPLRSSEWPAGSPRGEAWPGGRGPQQAPGCRRGAPWPPASRPPAPWQQASRRASTRRTAATEPVPKVTCRCHRHCRRHCRRRCHCSPAPPTARATSAPAAAHPSCCCRAPPGARSVSSSGAAAAAPAAHPGTQQRPQ